MKINYKLQVISVFVWWACCIVPVNAQTGKPRRFAFKLGINGSFVHYQDVAFYKAPNTPLSRESGTFSIVPDIAGALSGDVVKTNKIDLVLGVGARGRGFASKYQKGSQQKWFSVYGDLALKIKPSPKYYFMPGIRVDYNNASRDREVFPLIFGVFRPRQYEYSPFISAGKNFRLLNRSFFAELEYNHGISNVLKEDVNHYSVDYDANMKSRTLTLSVGIRF